MKSIHLKIIIIFFLIGIVIITGVGVVGINSINILENNINSGEIQDITQIVGYLNQMKSTNITALIVAGIVLAIEVIVMAVILSKFVIYPINKLIKSAEKITEEENKKTKNKKNENLNIENVLGIMTDELKEKLSEVSTQKNQIETILLHMTDGIIAFNMQGEIILINPAAKKFLSIAPEDITFDDIFSKFKLGINMEKIIYLENWTSTEQRIQLEDKYMKVFFAPFKN